MLALLATVTLILRPYRLLLLNLVWFVLLLCLLGLSLLLLLKRTDLMQALLEAPYLNNQVWACIGVAFGAFFAGVILHVLRVVRGLSVWPELPATGAAASSHNQVQDVLKQAYGVLERCWTGSPHLVRIVVLFEHVVECGLWNVHGKEESEIISGEND